MAYGLTQLKVDKVLARLDREEKQARADGLFAGAMPNIVFHYDGLAEGLHHAAELIRGELPEAKKQ